MGELACVDAIHKFAMGVKIKATGELKLNDSPAYLIFTILGMLIEYGLFKLTRITIIRTCSQLIIKFLIQERQILFFLYAQLGALLLGLAKSKYYMYVLYL